MTDSNVFLIDLESLEDMPEKYGVKTIAFTTTPAIKDVGLALSIEKKLVFEDKKKLQICAPLLIPMNIYRYDDESGDYNIKFTEESVEKITKQMMKNLSLSGKSSIFTNEHTDQELDAYILEVMLVDNEHKKKFIKDNFGYDAVNGTTWLTVQCSDVGTYDYLVENKKIGLSIDGLFRLVKDKNQNKIQMAEEKKEPTFEEGKKYHFVDGKMVQMAEEIEPKEEVKEEVKEVKEEVKEEVEEVKQNDAEFLTKADLSEALTPLIEAFTEMKGMINALKEVETEEESKIEMSATPQKGSLSFLFNK